MARRDVIADLVAQVSLDGTNFQKGMGQVNRQLKTVGEELKTARSEFKRTGDEQKFLGDRSRALSKQLKLQETSVDKLTKAYKESKENGEEFSKNTQNLERRLMRAKRELSETEAELKDVNQQLDGHKWKKFGDNVKSAGDNIQTVGDQMQGFGQSMSTNVTAPIVGLGTLAVESTRELREDMARLRTNAEQAGTGVDVMEKSMRNLNAITGETDSNVEALSNLMATGMSDNQLLQAVDDLSGAVIKFPDTLKIEGLADGLQETLATGKAIGPFAELLERMGVDLETFDEGLAEAKDSGDELNYALGELNDLDLSKVNDEFRKTNKELIDSRNAQYDFMDSLSELGQTLEPIATRMTESITEVVEAFNDLEPATQDNILKFAGLAAVVGPAGIALGGVTKAIGGVTKMAGGLIPTLGKAGGKGMLGRFALMGATGGPVGLAIAGVGLLGTTIAALSSTSSKNAEETLKSIEAREDELDTLDQSIERFDELQNKNKLSTDEVLRYMDIMNELKGAKNEDAIKALTEEQNKLLEKSGFTNEEMSEFLDLNEEIVDKSPKTAEAVSEQGNAYAETTEKVKELSEAKRAELAEETYQEIRSQMNEQKENLEERIELQNEINAKESEQAASSQRILDLSAQLREQDLVVADLKTEISEATGAEKRNLEGKLILEQQNLDEISRQLGIERLTNEELNKQIDKKENKLDKTNKELNQFDQLLDKYALMVLQEQGIVAEKGKGLETLRLQQLEVDQNKQKLKEMEAAGKGNTEEYDRMNQKVQEQQEKIDGAREKLEGVNAVAGQTIYKDVIIETDPTIDWVNRSLAGEITKTVNLDVPRSPIMQILRPNYAEGTDFHPGGSAIVGEEGPELIREGNRWSLADFGLIPNLDRGAQVFTHDETKKIMGALNTPAYATGISPVGEANRIVSQLSNSFTSDSSNQIIALLRNIDRGIREGKVIQIDGQPVTQIVNENNAVSNVGRFFE
ncbi:phage tail tape measure protein [Virgibacillus salexigens]|uniref:Phage tail tape measure protein domain-containing protein n=1 Tax=Virgibacillus kapii TaxID=1638645 RepID=A0ABQ2D8P3_9BACI|nr:hypothetical protein [Virgibacillus kapii]GGJ48448.1 hypothetical protein GCM10007111_08180 [Virgibacillus kapii]